MSLRKTGGPKRGGLAPHQRREPKPKVSPAVKKARLHIAGHALKLLKRDWKRAVVRGGCVMCRHEPITDAQVLHDFHADIAKLEGHHVLPKRYLQPEELRWDESTVGCAVGDNGVCLCRYHHEKHENYVEGFRLPRALVPEAAHTFAAKLNFEWLLDQEYPEDYAPGT